MRRRGTEIILERRSGEDGADNPSSAVALLDASVRRRRSRGGTPSGLAVITRGADGCSVVTGQTAIEQPGLEVAVVDTVGPGDAFSAAFLRDYLGGAGLEEAAVHANLLGGYVASRRGALPDYDGQIARALGL